MFPSEASQTSSSESPAQLCSSEPVSATQGCGFKKIHLSPCVNNDYKWLKNLSFDTFESKCGRWQDERAIAL